MNSAQDFLRLSTNSKECPIPLMNFEVAEEKCDYRHIPVKIVRPADLPAELRLQGGGGILRVTDAAGASLLSAAVSKGTWLSMPSLSNVIASLPDIKKIEPKGGSGAQGKIKKIDLAVLLVQHLFPDASEEETIRMVKAIMYQTAVSFGDKEEDILAYLEALDVENREAFDQVKRFAKEEKTTSTANEMSDLEELRAKIAEKAAAAEAKVATAASPKSKPAEEDKAEAKVRSPKRARVTPKEFKDLFPAEAEGKMFYFHDPVGQVFRVSYPT